MLVIMQAIAQISRLSPQELPAIALPQGPSLGSVDELARITGGSPAALHRAHRSLEADKHTVHQVRDRAATLARQCLVDLLGIGSELLRQAIPLALGLVVPNPAVQAASRAGLEALAARGIAQAMARLSHLMGELAAVARPLLDIAQTAVQSACSDSGRAAAHSLGQGVPGSCAVGSSSGPAAGSSAGQAAAQAALSQVGTPYTWGGTGSGGFDCSGLTQWAYRQAGIELPRLAQEQTVGVQVPADQLQPGDLVVWDGHVAMYSGNGQMVEAGDPVQTNPLRTTNMGMAFKGFWRPTG
ncbi:C40 family peptidase [Corynebacterium lizhenjunii]|uniref:C40 family peptidase n=1 Tax=Corynebacterium lizhenjunii TaxID=2709394 RepID=A0A7T0KDE5_9CORY|nr:C40 family peptidase [Corynebacterium lizhenjunii]QPK78728.1 C40 family peptidase [Corynebacterium lizhenjunii]